MSRGDEEGKAGRRGDEASGGPQVAGGRTNAAALGGLTFSTMSSKSMFSRTNSLVEETAVTLSHQHTRTFQEREREAQLKWQIERGTAAI